MADMLRVQPSFSVVSEPVATMSTGPSNPNVYLRNQWEMSYSYLDKADHPCTQRIGAFVTVQVGVGDVTESLPFSHPFC